MIARFRVFCGSLPAYRREAPCPFCFGKDIDAPLVELSAAAGFDQAVRSLQTRLRAAPRAGSLRAGVMTTSAFGVSDYLLRFVEALRRRGTPQDTIDRFTAYWNSLPAPPQNIPCPFCFAAGRVFALDASRGNGSMRCRHCNADVVGHPDK